MSNTDEALKIWSAIRPMIDHEIDVKTRSCVRARKMTVKSETLGMPEEAEQETPAQSVEPMTRSVTESVTSDETEEDPQDIRVGVADPYGDEVVVPSCSQMSNVQVGDPVWVYWYMNNASTMHVALHGNGMQGNADTERLQTMLEKEISDRMEADDGLYAYIDATASALRVEFSDGLGSLRSYVEYTASSLNLQFVDQLNSLRSYVEITASHLQLQFTDDLNSLRSYLEFTASHLQIQFTDDLNSLRSYLEFTASHLQIQFYDDMNSLRSYLEMTASHLQIQFYDDINSLRSYVELTASHLQVQFADDINSLRSYVELTAEHLQIQFVNDVDSLRSYVELTASHLQVQFTDDINSLRSYVELTASHLQVQFENDVESLRTYVDIQAGKIEMYSAATADNASILRQAGFTLDPDGILMYANTGDNALGTQYIQSAKEIVTYVRWKQDNPDGTRDQYENYIAQNAGGIVMSYVAPNGIKNLINMSTDGVLIQANKVNLSSYLGKSEVVITDDSITIGSQSISLEGYVKAEYLEANYLSAEQIRTTTIQTAGIGTGNIIASGYVVAGSYVNAGSDIQIAGTSLKGAINTLGPAASSGGQITIPYTTFGGATGSVNFNIADTQFYIDGVSAAVNSVSVVKNSWDGGIITFTTSAGTGASKSVQLSQGQVTWGSGEAENVASVPIKDGQGSTGYTVRINAATRYDAGHAAGYSAGYESGWKAACDAISLNNNVISGPDKNTVDSTITLYTVTTSAAIVGPSNPAPHTAYAVARAYAYINGDQVDYDTASNTVDISQWS